MLKSIALSRRLVVLASACHAQLPWGAASYRKASFTGCVVRLHASNPERCVLLAGDTARTGGRAGDCIHIAAATVQNGRRGNVLRAPGDRAHPPAPAALI